MQKQGKQALSQHCRGVSVLTVGSGWTCQGADTGRALGVGREARSVPSRRRRRKARAGWTAAGSSHGRTKAVSCGRHVTYCTLSDAGAHIRARRRMCRPDPLAPGGEAVRGSSARREEARARRARATGERRRRGGVEDGRQLVGARSRGDGAPHPRGARGARARRGALVMAVCICHSPFPDFRSDFL